MWGRLAALYWHAVVIGGSTLGLVAGGVTLDLALSGARTSQTITFTSTPQANAHVAGPDYIVAAIGGRSGNPVTFTSASPRVCRVSGSTVSFTGAGTCTIEANQEGSSHYLPAPTASQNFLVISAESIYSTNSATATVGTSFSFTVMASGLPPVPTLSFEGILPKGLFFVDNHDGTATISGIPAATTGGIHRYSAGGVYHLMLLATFRTGKAEQLVVQSFSLVVDQAPAITSKASKVVRIGSPFLFTVKASGYPLASITESGALPPGVSFASSGLGTAALDGTAAAKTTGTYQLTITASNGVGSSATQDFRLSVQK